MGDELRALGLDAEVAETVFNCKVFVTPQTYIDHVSPGRIPTPDGVVLTAGELGVLDSNGTPHPLPRYSTDIAAAWLVVERMHAIDSTITLTLQFWHTWIATFDSPDETVDGDWYQYKDLKGVRAERADTAPEAICRAALAALAETGGESG
jgi:hypothetical protein